MPGDGIGAGVALLREAPRSAPPPPAASCQSRCRGARCPRRPSSPPASRLRPSPRCTPRSGSPAARRRCGSSSSCRAERCRRRRSSALRCCPRRRGCRWNPVSAPASGAGVVTGSRGPELGMLKVVGASSPSPQAATRRDNAVGRMRCRAIERAPLLSMTWCVGVGIDIKGGCARRSGRRAVRPSGAPPRSRMACQGRDARAVRSGTRRSAHDVPATRVGPGRSPSSPEPWRSQRSHARVAPGPAASAGIASSLDFRGSGLRR